MASSIAAKYKEIYFDRATVNLNYIVVFHRNIQKDIFHISFDCFDCFQKHKKNLNSQTDILLLL